MSETSIRRPGAGVFGVIAIAIAGLAVVVMSSLPDRADFEPPALTDVVWSVVTHRDGSAEARAIDATTFQRVDDVSVDAPPADSPVLSTVFNGQGVAQLMQNGAVRWLGLTLGEDEGAGVVFEELVLWRSALEADPDAVRVATAGRTIVIAIDDGVGVYYRQPTARAQRLRLWSATQNIALEVGGAADSLVSGRGNGRLHVFDGDGKWFQVFAKNPPASFVGLADAGSSVLMAFDDGAIVGINLDSGVSYDVWTRENPRVAVAMAGTSDVSYVVDEGGALHALDEDHQLLVEVPGALRVAAIDIAARLGTAVAVDGSVMHFAATVDPELIVTWPADDDVVHASLIKVAQPDD